MEKKNVSWLMTVQYLQYFPSISSLDQILSIICNIHSKSFKRWNFFSVLSLLCLYLPPLSPSFLLSVICTFSFSICLPFPAALSSSLLPSLSLFSFPPHLFPCFLSFHLSLSFLLPLFSPSLPLPTPPLAYPVHQRCKQIVSTNTKET